MTNTQKIIAITPWHRCDPQIAIAASRAGGLGILDLGLGKDAVGLAAALDKLSGFVSEYGQWGIRWDTMGMVTRGPAKLAQYVRNPLPVLILAGIAAEKLAEAREEAKRLADQILLEVYDLGSAQAAQKAGYDGVIVKGNEAGGQVGRLSSFILLQKLHKKLDVPYWIQGGIAPHTAAAAFLAGATGIVLCEQLWLTEEGPLLGEERITWGRLDGSETVLVEHNDEVFRLYSRSGRHKLRELEKSALTNDDWRGKLLQLLTGADGADKDPLIPLGQDIAFAAALGKHYGTVGRVITSFRHSTGSHLELARTQQPLAPGSPLAKLHGTKYPIVQGPMGRVSDVLPFAKAVSAEGGLPFLALSVMRGPEVRNLLNMAKAELAGKPWGVGLLGFMPLAMRQEQLEVIKVIKPPFAIVAGGRPSQARELETSGISTYLHVPSAELLRVFIKEGARKFVLEGREAGGHVGPRTSFTLWGSAVDALLKADIEEPETIQILFAGGIHDALSAAMVASLAAPLAAQGMKVGVLMGSAYLFTQEAVRTGAVLEAYQNQALKCEKTVTLESAVGHAARCAKTPFCDDFQKTKQQLILAGKSDDEIFEALEYLYIGRLRIASKGIKHNPRSKGSNGTDKYVNVDTDTQSREGMYMLGDLATLRDATLSIADLHRAVSSGSTAMLKDAASAAARHEFRPCAGKDRDIAIVGMACMFPGAYHVRTFWENIINRMDVIREVSEERWRAADFFDPNRLTPDKTYSKWGGFLGDVPFDPTRYGIPPASLRSIEPMQLLALEVARQALEDAGFDLPSFPRERTAVIFGAGGMHDMGIDYIFRTMLIHYLPRVTDLSEENRLHIFESLKQRLPAWNEDSFPGVLGNVVAGRVANRFDLQGSNFTVDAACASSLAALHVGINHLRSGDADVVLVGASDGTNNAPSFIAFSKTQALSPRGNCRPFDDSADGIAISEGVAALVLKRLSDAEHDGDRIYAIIKGIGSSGDGRNRSLTAPHPQGQVKAVRRAYEDARIDPGTVELVEAHGTGTSAGDKAEIESLNLAFGHSASVRQYCAVGSVKSMIGHTKVTSGLASLIKCVLALKHRALPPTRGVEVPNSLVDFKHTPFYINTETRPWFDSHKERPRRAGVSAFGFGGTNFHAVLEEYADDYRPCDALDLMPRGAEIFAFRGDSRSDVKQMTERLLANLKHPDLLDLAQLAYSVHLEETRPQPDGEAQVCQLAIVATSVSDLKQKLQAALGDLEDEAAIRNPQGVYYRDANHVPGSVCFLFPGQGSQKVNMLKDLVVSIPDLYGLFEQADLLLGDRLPQALSRYVYPLPVFSDKERGHQQIELNATRVAQPALGVVNLAAFKVLKRFGVEPDIVAGHSYGEYVALCAAGVISEDDLIRLSEIRGRIVAQAAKTDPGTMAAVKANEATLAALISRLGLAVTPANMNTADQTVVAGSVGAIQEAIDAVGKEGLTARKIPVTAAFHTPAMAAAGEALRQELEKLKFRAPQCKVYSNTLGDLYPDTPDAIRDILSRHIAEPVRFLDQVGRMYQDGARVFIEVGPGRVLGGLVDRILIDNPHTTLHMDTPGRRGWVQLAHLLAEGLTVGLPVDLNHWFKNRRLADIGLDAVFDQARVKADPGPLTWRVNGGKASPWSRQPSPEVPRPEPSAFSARPAVLGSVSGTPPGKTLGVNLTQPKQERKKTEKMEPHDSPQRVPKPDVAECAASHSVGSQIQANVAQFIELQREQQRIMERFLDMQERLIATQMGHDVTAWSPRATEPAWAQPRPATISPASKAEPVPPAPVLPKFVARPSVKASNAIPASPPPTPGAWTAIQSASPPVVQPVTGTDADGQAATTEQFQADLLRAVSERTGYPIDMLDIDAHMEADLGIDSIKRVEVFSVLKDHHDLLEGRDEETVLEELAGLKTLRRIVEWYDTNRARALDGRAASRDKSAKLPSLAKAEAAGKAEGIGTATDLVRRYVVKPMSAPLNESAGKREFPKDQLILVVGEAPALSASLHAALSDSEYRVRQIVPGKQTRALGNDRFEADMSSLDALKGLHSMLTPSGERVGAVFNLMGLGSVIGDRQDGHLDHARHLWLLLKVLERDLRDSTRDGGGWLTNFTALDGQFGLRDGRSFPIGTAGTIGVAKSVAREWPGLRVKCIDVDLETDPHMLVAQVLEELGTNDPLVEVGFTEGGRWKLDLQEDGKAIRHLPERDLDSDSVVLVTGGAHGITAQISKGLAEQYRPTLVLVGRSTVPEVEGEPTRNLQDPQHLRQFLLQDLRAKNPRVSPADVEGKLKRLIKDRQIRANLAVMKEAGARVEYHALDVRDIEAFGNLIDELYAKWGRIDGVIHGAGVIEDKLIRDKSLESFETVFATKVIPATVLADRLRPERLKFVVFFSSVAARFGNVGQADYSAANEVLNKLAARLSHEWPNVHVVSINWGPWDSGMVTDELRRLYEAKGIRLVPADVGVRFGIEELQRSETHAPEVVIASSIQEISHWGLGDA